jgi:diguanylate cyclase (GGDEF)-like protein/PAS domain S-box-containing protein
LEKTVSCEEEYESLAEFLYQCPIALAQVDNSGRIEMMNPSGSQNFLQITSSPQLDNLTTILGPFFPDIGAILSGQTDRRGVLCEDRRIEVPRTRRRELGALVFSITLVRTSATRVMAIVQNVTWSVTREREARETEFRLRSLLDGARDLAVIPIDAAGRVRGWSRAAERLCGYTEQEAAQLTLAKLLCGPASSEGNRSAELLRAAAENGIAEFEGWAFRKSELAFWADASLNRMDGAVSELPTFSLVLRDSTRRLREREDLLVFAQTEPLTGLLTRRYFDQLATRELHRWVRCGQRFSAILVDCDRLQGVNEAYGRAAGDAVLRSVARACRLESREVDLVAHWTGDQIVMLCVNANTSDAMATAERVRQQIERAPVQVGAARIPVTATFGVAEVDDSVMEVGALFRRAEQALVTGKALGRNRVTPYTPIAGAEDGRVAAP